MGLKDLIEDKIPLLDDVIYFIPKNINTVEEYKKFVIYNKDNENNINNTNIDDSNLALLNENIESQFEETIPIYDDKEVNEINNLSAQEILEFIPMDDSDDSEGDNTDNDDTSFSSNNKTNTSSKPIAYISCNDLDIQNAELTEINFDDEEDCEDDKKNLEPNNPNEIEEGSRNIAVTYEVEDNSMDLSSLTMEDIGELNLMEEMTSEDNDYVISTSEQDRTLNEAIKVVESEGALDEEIDFINKINTINSTTDEDDFSDLLGKINLKEFMKNEKKNKDSN